MTIHTKASLPFLSDQIEDVTTTFTRFSFRYYYAVVDTVRNSNREVSELKKYNIDLSTIRGLK